MPLLGPLFVGPALIELHAAGRVGIIVDVALNGVLALDQLDIAALAGAERLADAGIAAEILVLLGAGNPSLRPGHDSFLPEVWPWASSSSRAPDRLAAVPRALACSASCLSVLPWLPPWRPWLPFIAQLLDPDCSLARSSRVTSSFDPCDPPPHSRAFWTESPPPL